VGFQNTTTESKNETRGDENIQNMEEATSKNGVPEREKTTNY